MVDPTTTRAQSKGVTPTISCDEGGYRPSISRGSQNMAAVAIHLGGYVVPPVGGYPCHHCYAIGGVLPLVPSRELNLCLSPL
jgi:hypothetical protein